MISSHSQALSNLNKSLALSSSNTVSKGIFSDFSLHQQWSDKEGWKSTLSNFRLIIQPMILFWMIIPWLDIFPNRHLLLGFHQLISIMNQFSFHFPDG